MKITLTRSDNKFGMIAETENGHQIPMDASEAAGGRNTAASPMQQVLAAAAGCSTIDIIDILTKQREPFTNINVKVEGDRAESAPRVFTAIHLDFHIEGDAKPEKVIRAVRLSVEKYCSVLKMLDQSAKITSAIYLNDKHLESI